MSSTFSIRKLLFAGVAGVALTFAGSAMLGGDAYAGQGEGKGNQMQGAGKGQGGAHAGAGQVKGKGGKSMEDIMRDVAGEDDDGDESDRPVWAGKDGVGENPNKNPNPNPGMTKGDLFGDMYVILRDANGVPILSDAGYVQPIDENGDPIPLDEDGHPIDESLAMEVELGRLNVSRAPTRVLTSRADEVVGLLNTATAITTDAAGRLVLTVDGEQKTIDSPLENLAIYVALMTDGSIPGVTADLGTYSFLNDGALTAADVDAAAAFLAGGADKTLEVVVDRVAYLNQFLDIGGTVTGEDGLNYFDFSSFDYDRAATFASVTATVLVETSPGVWEEQTVNIYDAVFGGVNVTDDGGIDSFTQAVDDSRAVINYVHEYEIPAESLDDVTH